MLTTRSKLLFIFFLFTIVVILRVYIFKTLKNPVSIESHSVPIATTSSPAVTAPEIQKIRQTQDLKQQVVLYTNLIKRVGHQKAQDDLYGSGLSFDGQTHLLNHTIGDYLYDTFGTQGLVYCKDYFLSSCYHGFVIRAVADDGITSLESVIKTCWEKSSSVAVQCAHAIGHGFLAWEGYKYLPKALYDCDELAKKSKNFPFYNCYDGVFMENVWAVHDNGKPSEDQWVDPNDPVFPCNDHRIAEKYIKACWSNQPMRMFQMYNEDIAKVAKECLLVGNHTYQETCFDALARQIHPLTDGNVEKTFDLCNLNPAPWNNACIISVARASFGIGDRRIPFELCLRIESKAKKSCYLKLEDVIKAYYAPGNERNTVCNQIPQEYRDKNCNL